MLEEAGVVLPGAPNLISIHYSGAHFPGDHVLLYLCRDFEMTAPTSQGEIHAVGWFAPDALPEGVTAGTRARIAEVLHGKASDPPALVRRDLVAQPALPQEHGSWFGGQIDKGSRPFGGVGGAGRGGHHHRQARVFQLQISGAQRCRHIDRAGDDAVRVDMSGVRAARREDVDPQAVETKLARAEIEVRGFCESADFLVQPTLEQGEGGIASRQIGQRSVGGVAPIPVATTPVPPGEV
eukprot:gene21857-26457_t